MVEDGATVTLRGKIEAVIAVVLLAGGMLAFRSWLGEHDLHLQAEEQTKAKLEVVQQNAQQIQQLAMQMAQSQETNAKLVQALQAQVAALKTPDQQLAWVVSQLKTQPGQPPITINVPKDQSQPATINVPQSRVPEVTQAVQGCEQCKLDLAAKSQQLSYSEQQKQKMDDSLKTMTAERDSWKTAAKGGNFWQRVGRAAKWLGIGAAAGAVALCGSGHCK